MARTENLQLITATKRMDSPHNNGQWMNETVGRFEGPLLLYATRLLSGDVNRARDVVQETFLRLWQGSRHDGPDPALNGHLAAWLYRVCRNACLDVRRKEHRMITLTDEPRIHQPSDDPPTGSNAGISQSVAALMAQLPESQQEALRLKFQGNLSYAEIAHVMDITVNHVGVLIHSAIKSIRHRSQTSATHIPDERLAS